MKHVSIKLIAGAALLALMGQGCLSPAPKQVPEVMQKPTDAMMPKEEATMPKEEAMKKDEVMEKKDEMMKPVSSTYSPYSKAAYDAAKLAGKPIFLFFYANWCPTCREQDPRLQKAVPAHMGGVVGFRVNFNDTETDADEKAIAKEFGVTYQHTGFFIGRDGATAQKTIGTITDAKTTEYLNLISK